MQKFLFSLCSISILGLSACTTTPNMQQTLTPYLDQFIGKSANDVKSTLNFDRFNFQSSKRPFRESDQKITYRILRPMRIPIPTTSVIGSASGGLGPAPSTSIQTNSSTSYDVNFNCDIHFNLKEDKVINWTYSGKAC